MSHLTTGALSILPAADPKEALEAASAPLVPLAPLATSGERALANTIIEHLLEQLPTAVAITVNDATTCLPLVFAATEETDVSPVAMAVQVARIARRTREMALAVAGPEEHMHEVILSSGSLLHIVYTLLEGRWHLYLAINPQEVNLSLARNLLEKAATALAIAHSSYDAA